MILWHSRAQPHVPSHIPFLAAAKRLNLIGRAIKIESLYVSAGGLSAMNPLIMKSPAMTTQTARKRTLSVAGLQ